VTPRCVAFERVTAANGTNYRIRLLTMSDHHKAVVLLSGGMDSCVCAAIARKRHGAGNVALLHAMYGQKTERRERQAFEAIADFYGVRERLVVKLDHFRAIGGSALTDKGIKVPENELEAPGPRGGKIPVTYVPFRNAHFLSVGVSWAEANDAAALYIGVVEEDSSGYPDCRPEYYRVFQELIRVGTKPETEITMITPVIAMKKSEIIRCGMELGAPLQLTWSCYQGEELACGRCDSCLLRLRAFVEAGVTDPIPYRERAGKYGNHWIPRELSDNGDTPAGEPRLAPQEQKENGACRN
jgi:7-cyano-7-deazaguanine synthase